MSFTILTALYSFNKISLLSVILMFLCVRRFGLEIWASFKRNIDVNFL